MKFFWGHQWYGEVTRQEKNKNKSFYFLENRSLEKINLRRIKRARMNLSIVINAQARPR